MTPATKNPMRYLLLTLLSAAALVFSASTHAQGAGISGAWVFERATDIDGPIGNQTNDLPPTLQILGDSFVMPKGCAVRLQREPASTGDVFQSLYKADVTEDQIATFYQKQFNLNIRDKKAVFRKATLTDTCYPHVGYFFQQGDKLVVSQAGGNFMFLYKRIIPIQSASGEGPYSQLPFHRGTYRILCPKGVTWSGRKPVNATTRCAPLYFPRIAMASSTDAIARLVGHHNYEGPAVGGQALSNDYSDPVGSGFRPIYQSLPPKGDIALVHVTDDELSESRDTMTGAYLSIRNGKVVSQLNSNCTMGLDYVCREMNSPVRYTLNEKGEFVEHTR